MLGTAVAFFLCAAQFGLLVGWCNTNSAIIRHAGADVWVMARADPCLRLRYGDPPEPRSIRSGTSRGWRGRKGCSWGGTIWQRPDGRRINVELVGLDESCTGGPWRLEGRYGRGRPAARHRHCRRALSSRPWASARLGQEFEMIGRRAVVGGVIRRGPHLHRTRRFVFTSIESAIRYDKRYRDDEVTYVLARCARGTPRASPGRDRARRPARGSPDHAGVRHQDDEVLDAGDGGRDHGRRHGRPRAARRRVHHEPDPLRHHPGPHRQLRDPSGPRLQPASAERRSSWPRAWCSAAAVSCWAPSCSSWPARPRRRRRFPWRPLRRSSPRWSPIVAGRLRAGVAGLDPGHFPGRPHLRLPGADHGATVLECRESPRSTARARSPSRCSASVSFSLDAGAKPAP